MKRFFKRLFGGKKSSKTENNTPEKKPVDVPGPIAKEEWQKLLRPGDHGIDISHHNKNVNLELVEQNFIFMKATEGTSFVSSAYHQRMDEAIKLQKNVGAYHYYRINSDPISQAKHFCKHLKGNLPPVLDIESINNSGYQDRIHTPQLLKFLEYVENYSGMTPIVYLGY